MTLRVVQIRGVTQTVDIPEDMLPESNPGWRGGIRQENTCRFCGLYDWAHVNGKHPDAPEGTLCHENVAL